MEDQSEYLKTKSLQYLDVVIEGFDKDDLDLENYANYLLGYHQREVSIAPSGKDWKLIPKFNKWTKKELDRIKGEITKEEARLRICAALKSFSQDTWDVAKIAIPIIVTLSMSGVVSIEQSPLYITVASIMIGRMGVASLCETEKTK